MFNLEDLQLLLKARPFVPFRFHLSDGGTVDVLSRELVIVGRRFALVGLLDPGAIDTIVDRWTTVWYLHVSRIEQLQPGALPFQRTAGFIGDAISLAGLSFNNASRQFTYKP